MNKDYVKGMRFLLEKSRERGINIRKCQWVPHVSKMLSEYNVCYRFWHNVWQQNRLDKVPLCNDWFDVMFDPEKYLFSWSKTCDGYSYWASMLSEVLGTHVSAFASKTNGLSRRLCD